MPKATRILSHFDNLPIGELVDQLGSVRIGEEAEAPVS